jgi:hypothetical protein
MIKIFTVTHKPVPFLMNQLYIPFQVGKESDIINNIQRDNKLDNISEKNPFFCELTATYWLWKNYDNNKYIGLCHYRRYFNLYPSFFYKRKHSVIRTNQIRFKKTNQAKKSPIKQQKKIISLLSKYDMIVPKAIDLNVTIFEDYARFHRIEDLIETQNIIISMYPEYYSSMEDFFNKETTLRIGNMFISSKKTWNDYHEWLFSILFQLEKKITIPEDNYQKRVFGFISERLFNLYLFHNNLKIKEIKTYFIGN